MLLKDMKHVFGNCCTNLGKQLRMISAFYTYFDQNGRFQNMINKAYILLFYKFCYFTDDLYFQHSSPKSKSARCIASKDPAHSGSAEFLFNNELEI